MAVSEVRIAGRTCKSTIRLSEASKAMMRSGILSLSVPIVTWPSTGSLALSAKRRPRGAGYHRQVR